MNPWVLAIHHILSSVNNGNFSLLATRENGRDQVRNYLRTFQIKCSSVAHTPTHATHTHTPTFTERTHHQSTNAHTSHKRAHSHKHTLHRTHTPCHSGAEIALGLVYRYWWAVLGRALSGPRRVMMMMMMIGGGDFGDDGFPACERANGASRSPSWNLHHRAPLAWGHKFCGQMALRVITALRPTLHHSIPKLRPRIVALVWLANFGPLTRKMAHFAFGEYALLWPETAFHLHMKTVQWQWLPLPAHVNACCATVVCAYTLFVPLNGGNEWSEPFAVLFWWCACAEWATRLKYTIDEGVCALRVLSHTFKS